MSEEKQNDEIEKNNVQQTYIVKSNDFDGHEENKAPIWLISFTDVIALMLTFFVLLYAMSDVDLRKFDKKLGITENAYGEYSGPQGNSGSTEGENINRDQYELAEDLKYLRVILEESLNKHEAMQYTTITRKEDKLVLIFQIDALNNRFSKFINEFSPILDNLNNSAALVASRTRLFPTLQSLGRQMREHGYSKPISLTIHIDDFIPKESVAIFIRPHTGKRIE